MPPKRRAERENDNNKMMRMEQMPTDHELFLQAFEKPTQIYRFLRTRSLFSPTFLNRTLTYMRHRMSRKHDKSLSTEHVKKTSKNGRKQLKTVLYYKMNAWRSNTTKEAQEYKKDFKVDDLLAVAVATQARISDPHRNSSYMNLTFTGFHDKLHRGALGTDTVLVETILLKLCHKKRKDVSSPVMQITVGQSHVVRNPDASNLPSTTSAVSVPSASFHINNGHIVKSYVLLFRVSIAPRSLSNGLCNGHSSDSDEPPTKRRKNGRTGLEEEKVYGAELIIFDKHHHCLLTDGDYELVLQEVVISKSSPKKNSLWETFDEADKALDPFDVFNWGPTLRFSLHWSNDLLTGTVPMPSTPLASRLDQTPRFDHRLSAKDCLQVISDSNRVESMDKRKKPRIFYQFLYNNNTRQQTEAREDLHCPWCSLNCARLYSLLKHLKLCHSRFLFTYIPHPKGARIDVSINECYDGSYTGNPHDLHSCPPGFAFSRNGPVRRTPVTTVAVCHPKRPPPSLSEFLEADDSEYDGMRPYIMGHNRLYHHSGTCLPVRPQEIDIDSEAENDPEWLRIKTKHMIDEFTDVNEGEKELMKLWNLHVMKYGFVGDCQIPLACKMFVTCHGPEVLQKKLYQNFVLHLCNLFDFGLIGAAALYQTVRQLQAIESGAGHSVRGTNSFGSHGPR